MTPTLHAQFILQGDDQPAVTEFVVDQVKWMRAQVAAQASDPYWKQVGLVLRQFDGMTARYAAAGQQLPGDVDLVLLNMVTEVGDIRQKVAPRWGLDRVCCACAWSS